MSRIGKKPIAIVDGVDVKVSKENEVTVKGPKGTLTQTMHQDMDIVLENGEVIVKRPSDQKNHRALHGLTRSLVANMIEGVTKGYEKTLSIVGVGYRAQMKGKQLVLSLGYSHPVEFEPDADITIEVPNQTTIIIKGIDKQKVGQVAAVIRGKRLPDAYKGKGIRYANEVVRLKEGKTGS